MGLVLGIISIVIGFVGVIFILFADGMSDAPSQDGISVWPWLISWLVIGGLLILSHYLHLSW